MQHSAADPRLRRMRVIDVQRVEVAEQPRGEHKVSLSEP
jgi:hypothetical protein